MRAIPERLSWTQASYGMVNGIFLPFYGAWLAWRGLPAGQIAWIMSAGYLLRTIAGPMCGIIADARNDRRETMLALYMLMTLGYGLMAMSGSYLFIGALAVMATTAMGAVQPLLESVCVRLAAPLGYQYGRVRLWASAAFVVMSVCGGLCFSYIGPWIAAPLMAGFSVLCVTATLLLPPPGPQNETDRMPLPVALRRTVVETLELLHSRTFLIFLTAASLVQSTHAFYYSFCGLHWRALGYSGTLIGVLWPLGVLAEILVLTYGQTLVHRFGPVRMILMGGAVCVLRWTVMAFDPPLALVVLAQFLHGGTFALGHIGAMYFILRAVPPRLAATAQSLYFVCNTGLFLGVATFVSGKLYAEYGGLAYLPMSVMGLAAIGFTLALARSWHGHRLIVGGSRMSSTTI